jgi:hypothetical protein
MRLGARQADAAPSRINMDSDYQKALVAQALAESLDGP